MAKPITLNKQHTLEELRQEIKSTRDGRYRLRTQAIVLVMQGLNSERIITQLMIGRDTLFRWIGLYNQKGLEGIKHLPKGGRTEGNPKWDKAVFNALFKKLDAMEEFFSVPKMQIWIKEKYNVKIPQNTIHHRLKIAGYTFKSSRPNPYKGDPALQASFKKMEL